MPNLVKDIKLASIDFIKEEGIFPDFDGWQDGYGAFTVSPWKTTILFTSPRPQRGRTIYIIKKELG